VGYYSFAPFGADWRSGAFSDGPTAMTEIEIKLRVLDCPQALRRLAALGWAARGGRELERNFVFDTPDGVLHGAGCLLRVRDWAGVCSLTLKQPGEASGRHKVKEEFEVEVSDCAVLGGILEGLGFVVAWRYEKYRTHFELAGAAGEIVLDETPIGDFLELEGEANWIDRTAIELGFSAQEYITDTYGALFEAYRASNPEVGADMVFPS
jgi:adenylate cyclase class 2